MPILNMKKQIPRLSNVSKFSQIVSEIKLGFSDSEAF